MVGSMYDYTFFNGQVVTIPLADPSNSANVNSTPSKSNPSGSGSGDVLSLKTILDIVRSIDGWLSLSDRHVAYIHCSNGISRTGKFPFI